MAVVKAVYSVASWVTLMAVPMAVLRVVEKVGRLEYSRAVLKVAEKAGMLAGKWVEQRVGMLVDYSAV